MTESELIIIVARELKSLSENLIDDNYTDAVDDAERETGFTLPVSDPFQIKWLKERTKRHLFFYLLSDNVESFKVKQISLHQKFDHLQAIVDKMDADFEKALNENALEFAGIDSYKLFGTKIDAGFKYNEIGEDITYLSDNIVVSSPNDEDL